MALVLPEVQRVRDVPDLTADLVGQATGTCRSTAEDWMNGRTEPAGNGAQRLIVLSEIVDQLSLVLQPAAIAAWLQRPISRLDNERPLDLLHRGDHLPVARLIDEMQYPGAS